MTWLWYLLSQHPEVEAQVHADLQAVLGGRPLTVDDLPHLTYTTMTIREAMRIYTPIWALIRRVVADDEIGGYHIPAGSFIAVSPYVTHRHPEYWENPEAFNPQRFAPERFNKIHHYAYIPFGGGPRICIGHNFAEMEALTIVAMVAQAYQLKLVPSHPVEMYPGITLRARHGMLMTLHQRK
jgi:cytochrome P450